MARATATPEEKARSNAYVVAWKKAHPERVKHYARQNNAKHREWIRERNRLKPVREGKPDLFVCKGCAIEKDFDLLHFETRNENKFKLSYLCRTCTTERSRRSVTRIKYGLTLEQARELRSKVCSICGDRAKSAGPGGMHIDHCHETGAIRGPLCRMCNRGVGHFRDRPDLLRKAADYLESAELFR